MKAEEDSGYVDGVELTAFLLSILVLFLLWLRLVCPMDFL